MATPMDIGEVSKRTGVPTSTLRYYDEKGLIQSVGRHGLRRLFDASVLEHLQLIALAQIAGFSLEEIKDMFSAKSRNRGRLALDRALLRAKADELSAQLKRMTAVRDGLLHAAECPAPSHAQCPKFQKMLRVAGKASAGKRRAARR